MIDRKDDFIYLCSSNVIMKNIKIKYTGSNTVINGNGAIAYVMNQVCGGVIGYPITPSTEISEIFEANRAEGGLNVWGKYPFFFSPEGEHSAQSGALGAALTGGQYISNASSSQGILYGMESHYVTVGKKTGGFVLQIAARVVSKHSLNVMAGHDDVYALLGSGYTVLFGSNPQEAADLAAIAYRASALSLIPVANAMDGFSTSHMLSEVLLPEPELLKEYLGDPEGRIKSPTVAQEMLYGAKGRVFQLSQYLLQHQVDIGKQNLEKIEQFLTKNAEKIEQDNQGELVKKTLSWFPEELQAQWRRQWINAFEKGTRQLIPALVDINNPGMTGTVQNQPDFQAGAVDHRTHFASEVPALVRQAMNEYSKLTGRVYSPIHTYMCEDAETVMIGLGSVTDDVEAVVSYLRRQGRKVGLISIKLLQPFPEAELVAALKGKRAATVLERSDQTELIKLVTQSLFKAYQNNQQKRYADIPAIKSIPQLTTAIFGLGGHDLQPRHLIAAFDNMDHGKGAPLVYLGSQFFAKNTTPEVAALLKSLKKAYPETEIMALETGENPNLLPEDAFRIRFHSVGGYGTIASGKLLTDILAGVLGMYSKSAPKYGSEKSGSPTNYYITLSPEPVKVTNAELENVEIVISPDHKVFAHTNPLRGLADNGTFILQSNLTPEEVWQVLPESARKTIRDKHISFYVIDAFEVAKKHAPTPELETRMMGIAFIGAVVGYVDRVSVGADRKAILTKVQQQISKKFGTKGSRIVDSNMDVIRDGIKATKKVDYESARFVAIEKQVKHVSRDNSALSIDMNQDTRLTVLNGLFDHQYYEEMVAKPFREGKIGESPVLPGVGLFMPAGSAAEKNKGLFRRSVPIFNSDLCTGCMECALVCPDAAIPNTVHDIHDILLAGINHLDIANSQQEALREQVYPLMNAIRDNYRDTKSPLALHEIVANVASSIAPNQATLQRNLAKLVDILSTYPVAKTRPFFDQPEKSGTTGGLYSVNIDPWKCTGCLECVHVCGPHALVEHEQDAHIEETLEQRFRFMSWLPNTPERFSADALKSGGDIKRLFLDHKNYYATTGGHGGCRGCGEVTAIRMVTATSRAIANEKNTQHLHYLETLVDKLTDKLSQIPAKDRPRKERIGTIINVLEKRLYLYESGPSGQGPSGTVIANSTGCSSVYASTLPYNCYNDPWVNSLFQDAQPLAKGIFEGIAAHLVSDIKAIRIAELELADSYDPNTHDKSLQYLTWEHFAPEELNLMPNVITIGGDGASYDIGFGAMSRILSSGTPIKMLVLNTGVYSNTGGQASTSSYTGQDSDLARFGKVSHGKRESRKELALIAAFHPHVYACSVSTSIQGHFLKHTLEVFKYQDGPSLIDVYTPCQSEHGIADNASNEHGRLAVESRMNPIFVHDPRKGSSLKDRFSLEGNPDLNKTWTTTTLEYLDNDGKIQLMDTVLTPATFAKNENRFKKHFYILTAAQDSNAVLIEDYIELPLAERNNKTPFVYSVDAQKRLIKLAVAEPIVNLVEDRKAFWQVLQYLGGQDLAKAAAASKEKIDSLMAQYQEAIEQRESSLDNIAKSMSELALSSKTALANSSLTIPVNQVGNTPSISSVTAPAKESAHSAIISMENDDEEKCTNCKTCYQELPNIFEHIKIVVNGESREVAHIIDGSLEHIQVTPELIQRVQKVKDNCDAEILR